MFSEFKLFNVPVVNLPENLEDEINEILLNTLIINKHLEIQSNNIYLISFVYLLIA